MKLQLSVALCAVLGLSACATVTRGTKTQWEVTSSPPGARVQTSHGFGCARTPCSIEMPRKSIFVATLSLPGYQDATVNVTNVMAAGGTVAMAGNAVIGGLIGVGVDASTGAMLDLTPSPFHASLVTAYRPAPSPTTLIATAAMGSNLVTHHADYIDQVVGQVQADMRSRLGAQSDQLADRHRAEFTASFDRSVDGSSTFIKERVVRIMAETATAEERDAPEAMTPERVSGMQRRVDQARRGLSATLVRSAWIRACGQAGASGAQDCAVYLDAVARDLDPPAVAR